MLTGTGTALVTPMNKDGTINEEDLRRLVDFQEENGVDMLLPCGSTGEAAMLSTEDHLKVIKIVVDQAKKATVPKRPSSSAPWPRTSERTAFSPSPPTT